MATRHQRRRVNQACNTCRKQKIRCDAVRPQCGTCERRREHCEYDDTSAENKRDRILPRHGTTFKPKMFGSIPAGTPSPTNLTATTSSSANETDQDYEVTATGLVAHPSEVETGTREYFGDSATLSFMQELQGYLPYRPTPSSRSGSTVKPNQQASLNEVPKWTQRMGPLPPRSLADHLVSSYFSLYHILYPYVHKPAFMAAYESIWSPGGLESNTYNGKGLGLGDKNVSSSTFYFGLNVIFACGCQLSDSIKADRDAMSDAFLNLCMPSFELAYLEKADLALCQTHLMMGNYYQGSGTPNRCWHLIGTACREAQALGLHSTRGDQNRTFAEIQMRRRVWHGCVMLDLAASSFLGRPAIISEKTSIPRPEPIDDVFLRVEEATCQQPLGVFSHCSWYLENLRLYDILRQIHFTLYKNAQSTEDNFCESNEEDSSIRDVIDIDIKMQIFYREMPSLLNWDSPNDENITRGLLRQRLLLRARFLYLKLLLYRPVLSQHLRQERGPASRHTTCTPGISSNYTMDCSVYCALAAIDLASLVYQNCSGDLSSVWWYNLLYVYTAGAVIIMAELSPSTVNSVTREGLQQAWEKCRVCFEKLGMYNLAAGQCGKTLSIMRNRCQEAISATQQDYQESAIQPMDENSNVHAASDVEVPSGPFTEDIFQDLLFDDDIFMDSYLIDLQCQ